MLAVVVCELVFFFACVTHDINPTMLVVNVMLLVMLIGFPVAMAMFVIAIVTGWLSR